MAEKKDSSKPQNQQHAGRQKGGKPQESASERNKFLQPPGPRSMGNAAGWLEIQLTNLRKQYGKLVGDMTTQNKYVRPAPLKRDPAEFSEENDPGGIEKALYIKERGNYQLKLQEDEANYCQMYSVLWSNMSNGSQQLLKGDVDFAKIERDCNPHGLVDLIKKTHMCVDNHSQPVLKNEALLNFYYTQLKQYNQESLYNFRTRFEQILDSFDSAGMSSKKPDPEEAAWDFILRLNEQKFPGISDDARLNINMKVISPPQNLDEAVDYINKWARSNADYAAKAQRNSQPHANASMFVTGAKKSGGRGSGSRQNDSKVQLSAEEKAEKLKRIKCYECHEMGHYSSKCPKKKAQAKAVKKEQAKSADVNVTLINNYESDEDEYGNIFMTKVTVLPSVENLQQEIDDNEILLDNESQASVIKNRKLLSNIRKAKTTLHIYGANADGVPLTANQVGDLGEFGEVYFHPKMRANVLSFALVRKKNDISYDNDRNQFTVTTASGMCYNFLERRRLYTCVWGKDICQSVQSLVSTVAENEKRYPAHLVRRAKEARRLAACLGYESDHTMWKILHTGAYANMGITPDDVRRAREIYGPAVPQLKGTTTKRKNEMKLPFQIEYNAMKDQKLHVDIMFVAQVPFLLGVSKPLNLTICLYLKSKDGRMVRQALISIIQCHQMYDFNIRDLSCDDENVLLAAGSNLEGVAVHPKGPGKHEKVAESKARRLKERMRAILHSLPYELPMKLLKWLIAFVVLLKNQVPVTGAGTNFSPRELLTGVKTDAKTALRIAFGVYVQVVEPEMDNSLKPRTKGAIALYPTGNDQGSVKFFCLSTQKVITRTSWVELPMSSDVIAYINSLSEGEGKRLPRDPEVRIGTKVLEDSGEDDVALDPPAQQGRFVQKPPFHHPPLLENQLIDDVDEEENKTFEEENVKIDEVEQEKAPVEENLVDTSVPVTVNDEENQDFDVVDEDNEEPESSQYDFDKPETLILPNRCRQNAARDYAALVGKRSKPKSDSSHMLVIIANEKTANFVFNLTIREGLERHGRIAEESIRKELSGIMFKDSWDPIYPDAVASVKSKIIPSRMFLREKFLANGIFDVLKSRLVAGGHRQDRSLYPDTSSPTPATSSIFIVASIAAKEGRFVSTMDIGSAYLNAAMEGEPVFMKLDAQVARQLCEVAPSYREYKNERHEIVVKLKKALYGCVQSAKLWYKHIRSTLERIGFTTNPEDVCVFNRGDVSTAQCTIVVYVDDLFVSCKDINIIDEVENHLKSTYQKITVHKGHFHSYLGMNFNFEKVGCVEISMEGYISGLLKDYNITNTVTTPANERLLDPSVGGEPLSEKESKYLHTLVARLLYVGTRVKPQIMYSVNFLCTRVNKFTRGDYNKALRVLEYLNGDIKSGLSLCIGENMVINLFVDASFATHCDGKSHSGCVVQLGQASVVSASTKQRLVTKSASEAELVGACDMYGRGVGIKLFVCGQGYDIAKVLLHQDNTSTINLIKNGQPSSQRTRHINVKYYYLREQIELGDLEVVHTRTESMVADILTKPVQGKLFLKLCKMLCGY